MFLPILIRHFYKMKKEKERFNEEWEKKTKDYDPYKWRSTFFIDYVVKEGGVVLYYPSKKDLWLGVIIWATIFVSLMMPIIGREWVAFAVMSPIAGFMIWLWFRTGYLLTDKQIKIMYGPLKKTINISDISKINKSKNPLSAPALSFNRLEIVYGKFYDFTLISPVNEREFILKLLKENPNIQLDEKLIEIIGER